MDLVPPVAKLMAEVISDPAGSTDGVREKDICQHENSHQVAHLLYHSIRDIVIEVAPIRSICRRDCC